MTKHYKLEHGDIIQFDSTSETVVERIGGRLIGIIGCEGKTCFIFRDHDDLLRFYLDNGMKPVTRLLILLTSTLTHLHESVITITSVKGDEPGQSRLHMTVSGEYGSALEGTAPYVIPSGTWRGNAEKISVILAALGVSEREEEGDGMPQSEAGEEGTDSETVVVDGLNSLPEGETSLSTSDTRRVVLARNHPVVIIVVKEDDIRNEDEAIAQIGINGNVSVITRTFTSKKEADAFLQGFRDAARYAWNYFFYPITDNEKVRRVLETFEEA